MTRIICHIQRRTRRQIEKYSTNYECKRGRKMRVDIKKETAIASGQRSAAGPVEATQLDRLDELESQSIFILREAFARLKRIAILWSLGKDSNVMIWIARKAFFGRVPCPAMHVDTGKKFPEMYAFRDRYGQGVATRSPGRAVSSDRRHRSDPAARRALGGPQDRRSQARARQARLRRIGRRHQAR